MNAANLRVHTRSRPGQAPIFSVEGYLDEEGAAVLSRRMSAAPLEGPRPVLIDLGLVSLFTCSGVRLLIATIRELNRLGNEVDLIGVHPPLQRILDLVA